MKRFKQRLLAGVMVLGAGLALATVAQANNDRDTRVVQTHGNGDKVVGFGDAHLNQRGFLDTRWVFSTRGDHGKADDTFADEVHGNGDIVREFDNPMNRHEFTDDDGTFHIHDGDDPGITPVPEPSNLWLMGTGLTLLALGRRRRGAGC